MRMQFLTITAIRENEERASHNCKNIIYLLLMKKPLSWLILALLTLINLSASPMLVFVGTYTLTTSKGIYALKFDPTNGSFSEPWLASVAQNPTFLAFDSTKKHIYASGELKLPDVKPALGGITAYSVDAASGMLTFINQEATGSGATTHLTVDATDHMVIACNYSAAYECSLPILPNGSLGPRTSFIPHIGPLGPNKDRQNQAHAHSVTTSPDNRFVMCCDLGTDQIIINEIHPETATLTPHTPSYASTPAGVGPRHSKFSADAKFFYVSNEMGGSVSTFSYDAVIGSLKFLAIDSTLPEDFKAINTVAEVRIHPNGKFIYVSNRGHDSIVVFSRNPDTGLLKRLQIIGCEGKHPRNFNITSDGKWLLVANRDTNNIASFSIDTDTGLLKASGHSTTVAQPVCIVFYN